MIIPYILLSHIIYTYLVYTHIRIPIVVRAVVGKEITGLPRRINRRIQTDGGGGGGGGVAAGIPVDWIEESSRNCQPEDDERIRSPSSPCWIAEAI